MSLRTCGMRYASQEGIQTRLFGFKSESLKLGKMADAPVSAIKCFHESQFSSNTFNVKTKNVYCRKIKDSYAAGAR